MDRKARKQNQCSEKGVMMGEPLFEVDLANFRTLILQGPDDATRGLIVGILDRWKSRDKSWQLLWEKMASMLPLRPPAGLFIASVIQTRRLSDEAIQEHAIFPRLERMATRSIDADWNSPEGNFARAAERKHILREAAHAHGAFDRALGREKQMAQRRRYIELWSDHFRDHAGKPAHEIVAMITEIAFGGKVDPTDVQDALRFRRRRDRDTQAATHR